MSLNIAKYTNSTTEDLITPIPEIGLWRAALYRAISDIETYHLHEDPSLERYYHAKEARAWFQSVHQIHEGSFEWICYHVFNEKLATDVMAHLRKKYKPEIPKPSKLTLITPVKTKAFRQHPYIRSQPRYAFVM